MITNERADALTEFFKSDKKRTKRLLLLSDYPKEAVAVVNCYGYDYTESELVEFQNTDAYKKIIPKISVGIGL